MCGAREEGDSCGTGRGSSRSCVRSVRRQRDGQQRVADKEIGLRHIVDADMPADFLIKIYHLKN